jgi:hypothetical protein
MSRKKKSTPVLLERDEGFIEIDPEIWAEIILYLNKRGWQPSIPAHWFLAPNLIVSKADAIGIALAGQRVLDDAIRDPMAIYPLPFDMGKLAELVCFFEEGAFRICKGANDRH